MIIVIFTWNWMWMELTSLTLFAEKWIESVEKFKNGLPWRQKKDEGIL
jgi:hypothetical protein